MSTWGIGSRWDGQELPAAEHAVVRVEWGRDVVHVHVEAPFAADPAPSGPPGPTPMLWEHEVVEWFVLGDDGHYTELELGPHGHHLLLQLDGVRSVVASLLPVSFTATRDGGQWRGQATVARHLFPARPVAVNAYRIHGEGSARRYHAHAPVPGPAPDFHRLACFAPWSP